MSSKPNFYDQSYYSKLTEHHTRKTFNDFETREFTFCRDLYVPQKGDRLLDVGCGLCNYLLFIEDLEADLWGIDISEQAINAAKTRIKKPDQILCCNAPPIPFEDNSFDIVTAFGTVEHFEDIPVILKDMLRVLKPKGHAVIMVPNTFYYKFVWETFRNGQGPVCHQKPERLYAYREWRELIEEAGFKILRVDRHNKFNKPRFMWLRNLLIPFYFSNHFAFIATK